MWRGSRWRDRCWLSTLRPWELLAASAEGTGGVGGRMEIFTGMLVYDGFSVFMRGLLLGFLVLFIVFTAISGIPDRDDGPDIYSLVLGATLGFCLMAAANHLLMVFMAVEMASVPCYVLAGMLKGRKVASEAALKYCRLRGRCGGRHAVRDQPAGRARSTPCTCRPSRSLGRAACRRCPTTNSMVLALGHAVHHGWTRLQAIGRPVPLLVPRRISKGRAPKWVGF